jgi:uncharacterized protein YbjQ (UPF0145 family)
MKWESSEPMGEFILQHSDFFIFIFFVALGYGAGSLMERNHYRSIRKREQALLSLPVTTTEHESFIGSEIGEATLVVGSVVVSIDYFKRLLAILRNIFGGAVTSYESLVDRARREAILRMKEAARQQGAALVINLRLETSAIGQQANRKRQVGSVEAIAYGTAIILPAAPGDDG